MVTQDFTRFSVRLAQAQDAPKLGQLHAALIAKAQQALGEPAGPAQTPPSPYPSADELASSWATAIAHPPHPDCQVWVAMAESQVVGFLACAPTQPATTLELLTMTVDPAHQRRGHGSRLLAAAAEKASTSDISTLQMWVLSPDEALFKLLNESGFAPQGSRRQLRFGQAKVWEHLWYCRLTPNSNPAHPA